MQPLEGGIRLEGFGMRIPKQMWFSLRFSPIIRSSDIIYGAQMNRVSVWVDVVIE